MQPRSDGSPIEVKKKHITWFDDGWLLDDVILKGRGSNPLLDRGLVEDVDCSEDEVAEPDGEEDHRHRRDDRHPGRHRRRRCRF